jgi:tight adherence protein B
MTGPTILLLLFAVAFASALLAARLYWMVQQTQLQAGAEGTTGLFKADSKSSIQIWGKFLEQVSHVEILERHLRDAGLSWSAGRVTLSMLLCAAVAMAILMQIQGVPLILLAIAAFGAASLPYFYILRQRRKRFDAFARLLPEAFDSMARALQAGFPLAVCIESMVQEQAEPLASELRRVRDEWRLGLGWEHAMNGFAARIPIPEAQLFAAAVKLQSRTGGRLNLVLVQLSENLREATALDGEVRTLSAHSRMTGTVLSILPVVIAGLLFVTNPSYLISFLAHPTGRTAVVLAVIANIAAHLIIRQLSRIED